MLRFLGIIAAMPESFKIDGNSVARTEKKCIVSIVYKKREDTNKTLALSVLFLGNNILRSV
jgi:hypothetical protein